MTKALVNNKARVLCFTLSLLAITGVVAASQVASHAAAVGDSSLTTSTTSMMAAGTGTYFDHVVIIVMEDHGINQICARDPPHCLRTNGDAYTAGLANSSGVGCHYTDVAHFSPPDSIALLR